jgi:hypothetical protein
MAEEVYMPLPDATRQALIRFLREAWDNDGAEGESVHRLCDELDWYIGERLRADVAEAAARPGETSHQDTTGEWCTPCNGCGVDTSDHGEGEPHTWKDCAEEWKRQAEAAWASDAHEIADACRQWVVDTCSCHFCDYPNGDGVGSTEDPASWRHGAACPLALVVSKTEGEK